MKKYGFNLWIVVLIPLSLWLNSCKEYNLVPGFSDEILSILSEEQIDSLRSLGMNIHEGRNPPDLQGIYRASPYELLVQYAPDDNYRIGQAINDYKYRFYDYNERDQSIKVDFKQVGGSDNGTGTGGFVSGKNNEFTIFSEDVGNTGNADYVLAAIYSGRLVEGGIEDFQYAFVITSKNDPSGRLIPVNTGRVWIDGDGLAEEESVFRRRATEILSSGSALSAE